MIMCWNVLRISALRVSKQGRCNISLIQNIHPSTEIAIEHGKMTLAHSVFTRKNVCFRVCEGEMIIGTSFFNQNCCVTAKKKILIGDNCLFGPNVVIVDHDHNYHYPDSRRGEEYLCDEVTIGNNVVVGANTVILKGCKIGDNCVIGAGSVVWGNIKPGMLYYDKRERITKVIEFNKIDGVIGDTL